MKTLTQVVLPIVAVIGLVGFVTFIANYSKQSTQPTLEAVESPPLHFPYLIASPEIKKLDYWRSVYEVGEKGHFDFWFTNVHPDEVAVSIESTSCKCTSVELGLVPKEAWREYQQNVALQGFLPPEGSALFGIANLANFSSKVEFRPLIDENTKKTSEKPTYNVPAADPQFGPAVGIVRMNWVPAGTDPVRKLDATILSRLPKKTAFATKLMAQFRVSPPLHIFVPQTESADLRLGIIPHEGSISGSFICWSATRPEMKLAVAEENLGKSAPCVEWTAPVALNDEEIQTLIKQLTPKDSSAPAPVASAYRVKVTAWEHRTLEKDGQKSAHELDIGPLDFRLVVTNQDDGYSFRVPITGLVGGDVRLSGNAVDHFRINLGDSFDADSAFVTRVAVFSDRPGLDLELLDKETKPEYLKVELLPINTSGALKEWELKITVPANTQIGPMPRGSFIALRMKDATQRRIRIPIRGIGVGSGSPRL